MKLVFGFIGVFLFLSLLTPYFFKNIPFLSLPLLSLFLILLIRRDLQDLA